MVRGLRVCASVCVWGGWGAAPQLAGLSTGDKVVWMRARVDVTAAAAERLLAVTDGDADRAVKLAAWRPT